jgi:hypothetical protein
MLLRRKLLLLGMILFVLLCSSLVASVDAASMWSQAYGGTGNDKAYSLVETSDGGYALAGTTDYVSAHSISFGGMCLVKTDALGKMEWNKTYGEGSAHSVVATSDGGYAITGSRLVRTDANGNMEWNKTYGGNELVVAPDGGYAIVSTTDSVGAGGNDFLLVKTDALGNMEWNKTYAGTGVDGASSLVATSDGGYAIAGYTSSFSIALDDFLLVKTDALGNMEWNKTYGGTGDDIAYSVVVTSDGGYAMAGVTITNTVSSSFQYFLLVKTDVQGNMEWNKTYGEGGERAWSLVATSDGGYAIAGETSSYGAGSDDFWLVKTDENGMIPTSTPTPTTTPTPTATASPSPTPSVPEFPLLMLTTSAFTIINKKRLLHKRP